MDATANVSKPSFVAIVDDDDSIRNSTRRLVRSLGFRAEAYASAREFLEPGQVAGAACVILDLRMPEMDGLELQRHLSGMPGTTARLPIIFISGHANEDEQRRALEAGAVGFLRKPVSEQALSYAITAALRRDSDRRISRGQSPLDD